ncbi:SHOCT domain-containing protein [Kitasatospora cinereorecta]|uniref:SHOCT domain-containing protein n=1 Tax=Kitasatospora cinereorecta TaxID=285560 RepID=A0ABW0VGB0_9ACTN
MDDYPLLNVFWTMLWFFLWILWFFLLFKIITDIFRSHDMGGWGKAGWLIFVILLPFLGVLVYLIARGRSMSQRDIAQAQQNEAAFKAYIRDAAGPGGEGAGTGGGGTNHADQLAKLADLKNSGALTEEEYQKAKDKLLA